jgi:hypothetical protein
LLLDNQQCARAMGIGINRFYELRRVDPDFPKPVDLPSAPLERGRPRQLRSREDIEAYVRGLRRRPVLALVDDVQARAS